MEYDDLTGPARRAVEAVIGASTPGADRAEVEAETRRLLDGTKAEVWTAEDFLAGKEGVRLPLT